jgi:hypothetical protein
MIEKMRVSGAAVGLNPRKSAELVERRKVIKGRRGRLWPGKEGQPRRKEQNDGPGDESHDT